MRFGDGFVRDLAVEDVDASRKCRVARDRFGQALVAIASTYGSVAFVSAFVAVIGTAPGMFATQ